MTPLLLTLVILLFVGMIAGFVDTLAGGGGMLTIPALLIAGLSPEAALATNKLQGTVGSSYASFYFIRQGKVKWQEIWRGCLASCVGASIGAYAIQNINPSFLEKFIPILLIAIALLLLFMPQLGEVKKDHKIGVAAFAIGFVAPIGFYDGFIGPGTGTFFMLALVTMRGYTITDATIRAKTFNMISNVVALVVFMIGGHIVWIYGIAMGIGQMFGAKMASKMVITKGSKIIKPIVITMSILMSATLIYRYWLN